MRLKRIIYLIPFITLIISSCEDKNSTGERKDYITAGDYAGLKVKQYDAILTGGYNDLKQLDIDIDNDGNNDFKLSSELWGSMGLGIHPTTKIASINSNSLLNVTTISDTDFIHTTYYDTAYAGRVWIYTYNWISCWKDDVNDTIYRTVKRRYLNVFYASNNISRSDEWVVDTLNIAMEESTSMSPYNETSNDTSYVYWFIRKNNCHYVPDDEVVYIGIKKTNGGETKLGWIKLKVSNKLSITLIETAIQL